MKFLKNIDKTDKKNKVILIGKGPSVDKLDLMKINNQKDFDICTISDSVKIINQPKFNFQYHWLGMQRCRNYLIRPQNLMIPIVTMTKIRSDKDLYKLLEFDKLKNIILFEARHIKLEGIKTNNFDIDVNDVICNFAGSVVGCINFLAGYMKYKEIHYIGFDGGHTKGIVDYGYLVYNGRKGAKKLGCSEKYFESWQGVIAMMKFYPDIKLLPLQDYLIRRQ